MDVSVSRVGVLMIGSGVRVRVPVSGRRVVGMFSVAVILQETSRTLSKMKAEIFRTEPSALIMVFPDTLFVR
jgi:hypothetical protein